VQDNPHHSLLLKAYDELKTHSTFTIQNTLRILAKSALIIDCTADASTLPHVLCNSLYSANNLSPLFFTMLVDSIQIPIPPRSELVLLFLAFRLNIAIFLFSGRAKPIVFMPPAPESSLALFHCIDPLGRISTVHPLVVSDRIVPRNTGLSSTSTAQPLMEQNPIIPPATWRAGPRIHQQGTRNVYPGISRQDCINCLHTVL
jgi:hypothetical protein